MFLSSMSSGLSAYVQKHLYIHSEISPYEAFYWSAWIMLLLKLSAMSFKNVDPFHVILKHRLAFILRGVIGVISNTLAMTSLLFIPLTKSTVLYWTLPLFTGIFA